ncbi:CD3072 family TudS-related putative desulfidase [Tindallia californiensis]|uniref:Predicted secreted protein n=1 Tax=Tindallia californiensis TaxID=159292 RepID=A0A1H3Q2Y5_9FIRM|nr:CD3072 family TudS-related putative desulfidase [Tindallia californiensis]SDZ07593.1 Predicted secreted protein [Tindallia californiensis]
MKRSKKIVLLAHCLLNVNSKIKGLANYSAHHVDTLKKVVEEELGIIQLPCPEITYLGMDRWGMTKNQYSYPAYRNHCRQLLKPVIDQIREYEKQHYEIVEVVGIDGSPSCGVQYTETGYEGGMVCCDDRNEPQTVRIEESGVYMEELMKLLNEAEISLKFSGIDEK